MSRLSPDQQQLIMDFYFRCGSEEDINRGRDLIASDSEAARLYAGLEDTLTDLDSLKYEPCPDNLADLTVARLKLAASARKSAQEGAGSSAGLAAGGSRLRELLDREHQKDPASAEPVLSGTGEKEPRQHAGVLRVFFEFGAMAAAVVLVTGLLFPTLSNMRARSQQVACAANIRAVGDALSLYANDDDHNFASARVAPGSPWWKIGYQSAENQSNTRYVWRLVRQGYVDGKVFVCPGQTGAEPVSYDEGRMKDLQDFPHRRNVSYSFMLMCKTKSGDLQKRKIIMSDLNPVFVRIPTEPSIYQKLNEFEKVCLDEHLKQMLSPNHAKRGQNVLFCDGSVEFLKDRHYDGDDIYTIQDVTEYTGTEAPTVPGDLFLVP